MLSSPSPPRLSIVQTFARKEFLPLIPDRVWLLEKGLVRTLSWNSEGRVTTFGIWGRGDVVGLPLSRLSPYQVECLTPVVVTEILPDDQSSFLYDALLKHLWYSQELFDIVQKTSVSRCVF
ncbi:MAG: Crp/Fnr family transcriptional regulator, partial [Leptolyngbyaceae cyanobacterium SM2_3_12]|nr:Crp/Fnr family transcriptional regulator [Leptolyngbyaceae cyanobacterium SM2_3_12]